MPDTLKPFPTTSDPFLLPLRKEFGGWPQQILLEVFGLLQGRDGTWLNLVAAQVNAATDTITGLADLLNDFVEPNLTRSGEAPFGYLVEKPGRIGMFAAREQRFPWHTASPSTERWERYAVFALLCVRDAIELLEATDRSEHAYESDSLSFATHDRAGVFLLEAMRALQVVHSLRIDSRTKSELGRHAAKARHEALAEKRAEAVAMANAHPFTTKRAAIDFIVENLELDPVKKSFPSRRSVEEWLMAASWVPAHKRAQK